MSSALLFVNRNTVQTALPLTANCVRLCQKPRSAYNVSDKPEEERWWFDRRNSFRLSFRIIPHRFPWWPWEELHLSAEQSQWQHRSIDLSFVLSEQPSVDTLEECRELFHPQQPGWGWQLSEAVVQVTPQSHTGFCTQPHVTYIIWSRTLKKRVKCKPVWLICGCPMLGEYIGIISAHAVRWRIQHAGVPKLAKDYFVMSQILIIILLTWILGCSACDKQAKIQFKIGQIHNYTQCNMWWTA